MNPWGNSGVTGFPDSCLGEIPIATPLCVADSLVKEKGLKMFGLSLWEIMLVVVAAIVLVRPKDWPAVARKVGRIYGEGSRLWRSVTAEVNKLQIDPPASPTFHQKTDTQGGRDHARND